MVKHTHTTAAVPDMGRASVLASHAASIHQHEGLLTAWAAPEIASDFNHRSTPVTALPTLLPLSPGVCVTAQLALTTTGEVPPATTNACGFFFPAVRLLFPVQAQPCHLTPTVLSNTVYR
jgi:hypothetical protein